MAIRSDKWYICDPVKNTECSKEFCVHRMDAACWMCDKTHKEECAVMDEHGAPIEVDFKTGVKYPVFRSTPELCRPDS